MSNLLGHQIELFSPLKGLTENEIFIEKPNIDHYAFQYINNEFLSRKKLMEIFNKNKFLLKMIGSNTKEKTSSLYYRKKNQTKIINIELINFYENIIS